LLNNLELSYERSLLVIIRENEGKKFFVGGNDSLEKQRNIR